MKERRGGAGACPRGVAEFTKTVAEFTKYALAGQKGLQVLMILFIFVAKLLITIIAAGKPQNLNGRFHNE